MFSCILIENMYSRLNVLIYDRLSVRTRNCVLHRPKQYDGQCTILIIFSSTSCVKVLMEIIILFYFKT